MTSLEQLLQQTFGFSQFRTGQARAIDTVLAGRNCAAIFPTGSGKSLCYQLPALQLPHLTLVISPLLALMQDQLDFLHRHQVPAASIDSAKSREEISATMAAVRRGEIKLLMISVERFKNERFRHFLQQIPLSLLVIDEAHCISEWGHNFRPDYLKLPAYQRQFNIPQVLLLTATATPRVMADMADKFAIAESDFVVTGFYRPNLNLRILGVTATDRDQCLATQLQQAPDAATIVYVTLQHTAEAVAERLQHQGINARAYHAGMPQPQREGLQQAFMNGDCTCIVATIAFGMGIDKNNVRRVVHYDLPKSIENYSQEIGRAGRDGQPADCLVLANRDSVHVLENFVYGDTPEPAGIRHVLAELQHHQREWPVKTTALANQAGIRQLPLKTLLVYLEMQDIIRPQYSYYADYRFKLLCSEAELMAPFDARRQAFIRQLLDTASKGRLWYSVDFEALGQERGRAVKALDYLHEQGRIELESKQLTEVYQIVKPITDIDKLTDSLHRLFLDKQQSEIDRIQAMMAFFESRDCLSNSLAGYFGDHQLGRPCGHCSVCQGNPATLAQSRRPAPLAEQDFAALTAALFAKLPDNISDTLITRFLCGITTPQLTRIKARQLPGHNRLADYRYGEVQAWVQQHR